MFITIGIILYLQRKPYSCKLVELQDLNTFPVIDLTPTSIALTDTTLLNPEKSGFQIPY